MGKLLWSLRKAVRDEIARSALQRQVSKAPEGWDVRAPAVTFEPGEIQEMQGMDPRDALTQHFERLYKVHPTETQEKRKTMFALTSRGTRDLGKGAGVSGLVVGSQGGR